MKVTIEDGLKIIKSIVKKKGTEIVPLENALLRVAAEDKKASFNLPRFDNSAMDGYAIRVEDRNKKVKIVDTILAGEKKEILLNDNFAIKITTGAKIPKNFDAVIPIEDANIFEEYLIVPSSIKKYTNIRRAGEDVKKGDQILNNGKKIDAHTIALLAAFGNSYIKVYKKVRIGIFATGKELKMHYENIEPHQIYNSNTPLFYTRAKELGCEVSFLGNSDDNIDSIKKLIKNSLDFDMIITSGGVSVGEADLTKDAFLELGANILFDKVEIKPGKPTTFATLNSTYILNLPGNPLAAALNFEIFGRFIINILSGREDIYQNYIEAILKENLSNKSKKEVVIPGFFDGKYFSPSPKRGPGMVSPLSQANGYIILHRETTTLKDGSNVKFIPIDFEFYSKEKKELFTRQRDSLP